MPHHHPPPAVSGSPEEIEAQFYEALRTGDLEQMMAVWADDEDIVCVHPGGPRIVGAAAIRASFEAIFANSRIPVAIEQVRRLQWVGGALHHLLERIDVPAAEGRMQTAWVIACNVYVRTAQGWRLAAHHASPGMAEQPPTVGDAPATLH